MPNANLPILQGLLGGLLSPKRKSARRVRTLVSYTVTWSNGKNSTLRKSGNTWEFRTDQGKELAFSHKPDALAEIAAMGGTVTRNRKEVTK